MSDSNTKRNVFLIILILLILAVAAFLLLRHHSRNLSAVVTAGDSQPSVTVTKLQKRNIPLSVTAYATTISPDSVQVDAKVPGVVSKIYFKAGQKVQQGQLLFKIKSTDMEAQLSSLKSKVTDTERKYESYLKANKEVQGTVSQNDIADAKAGYDAAISSYETAKDEIMVAAPTSGVVSDTNLAVGSSVQTGDALLTLIHQGSLQLKYSLPGKYNTEAKVGQHLTFVPSDTQQHYAATVSYVAPQLDSDNNLIIRANFEHINQLQPNMFGQISQIIDQHHEALAVQQSLVQSDAQGFYLYVVDDGKVDKKYIKIGKITQQGYVAVQEGITADDLVITSDPTGLSEGQNVKVQST